MVVDPWSMPDGRGTFEVHSESGNTYLVDLGEGTCSCPDFSKRENELRNSGGCKHQRRVRAAVGIDPIDPALREHADPTLLATRAKFVTDDVADDEPEIEVDAVEQAVRERVVMTDGGHGREHADGCTDARCEGLDAPGRPELSFECWGVWSAESHDWTDDDDAGDADDVTPDEDDMTDLAVEQVVTTFEARGQI
ncbi:SWIM zinc finger family protein [Halalkalicoccus salilacus]|uniref:SWIM zinc finger family protein n=1 Tax=Halalkalicoccus TaxID=332246 RepID=UPI002F96A273